MEWKHSWKQKKILEREWADKLQTMKHNQPEVVDEAKIENTLAKQDPQKTNQELFQDYASEDMIYNNLAYSIAMEHIFHIFISSYT